MDNIVFFNKEQQPRHEDAPDSMPSPTEENALVASGVLQASAKDLKYFVLLMAFKEGDKPFGVMFSPMSQSDFAFAHFAMGHYLHDALSEAVSNGPI